MLVSFRIFTHEIEFCPVNNMEAEIVSVISILKKRSVIKRSTRKILTQYSASLCPGGCCTMNYSGLGLGI